MSTEESHAKMMHELIDEFVEDNGDATVGAVVMVADGHYRMQTFVAAHRADVYQAIGILDQLKYDLLARIPVNRPLREPPPEPGSEVSLDYTPKTAGKLPS